MRHVWITCAGLTLALSGASLFAQQPALPSVPDYPALVKKAVERSLPTLQKSATTFVAKSKCVSCHHQALASMTFALTRERGFNVDEKVAKEQAQAVYNLISSAKGLLQQAGTNPAAERIIDTLTVDPASTVSYLGSGLAAEQWKRDELMELAALYLARKQTEEGYWPVLEARPPIQSSDFSSTALAVRVLRTYAPDSQAKAMEQRIERARNWMKTAAVKTNEDRVFRLLGLHWSGVSAADLKQETKELLATQRDDGGWSQMEGMGSDAYATGQALVALNQAGGIAVTHPAYQRGYKYLLKTQKEDGSWFVEARSIPVQVFLDTDFPHGKSQFISFPATCWATMALALTVEPPKSSKVAAAGKAGLQ